MKIQSLTINVTVAANITTTIFDVIFYNPNDRILEGELEFLLPISSILSAMRLILKVN
jgi:hypothetical protein